MMKQVTKRWYHALRALFSEPSTHNLMIVYYPGFDNKAEFNDHYYRMIWYLHPIIDRIKQIVIPFENEQFTVGSPPPFLDPQIKQLFPEFQDKVVFKSALNAYGHADIVMFWRVSQDLEAQIKRVFPGKRIWRVDHQTIQHAASYYLKASSELDSKLQARHIEESRDKFHAALKSLRSDIGYIFGTGPNLQQVIDRDFSDGVAIACNSMLKNKPLMENLRPPIIAVADPIFHAGPSAYAGRFRNYLYDAMTTFGSYLIVPIRDYALYCANLDSRWQNRIIGIPFVDGDKPNLDIADSHFVTTTSNIMTLFLLPLSTTLFNRIYMAGFDGRPLEENGYFWQHDPASQIVTEMDSIQRAHPAFFQIDYDDYYLRHINIVERWIEAAEREGKTFHNLTPSHVPAISARG